jgi:hypothetical protein
MSKLWQVTTCARRSFFALAAAAPFVLLLVGCAVEPDRFANYADVSRDNPTELAALKREHAQNHMACVMNEALRMVYEERWSDAQLDAACAIEERLYYKSVYYSSMGGPEGADRPDARHNTARDVVLNGRNHVVASVRRLEKL